MEIIDANEEIRTKMQIIKSQLGPRDESRECKESIGHEKKSKDMMKWIKCAKMEACGKLGAKLQLALKLH